MVIEFDYRDEQRVKEYEEGLYQSFPDPKGSPLRKTWIYNHEEKRIILPTPKEHIYYYGAVVNDRLTAACSFNFTFDIPWKIESLGFKIDKSKGDVCEGLTLFSLEAVHDGKWVYEEVNDYTLMALKKRGINRAYGTCTEDKIDFYRGWGHDIAAIKIIDYEKIYLTVKDF